MRSKLCIITIVACAALTGCSNVPDLSHVDNDLTAQYMADALLKAGKNFDLVILPGQAHGFMGIQQAFYQRKMWFHFAKHLLGDYSSDQFREIDAYMRL